MDKLRSNPKWGGDPIQQMGYPAKFTASSISTLTYMTESHKSQIDTIHLLHIMLISYVYTCNISYTLTPMECAFLYRHFCHSVMQLNISMTKRGLKTCIVKPHMWMASVNQRSSVAINTVTYKHIKASFLGTLQLKNEVDKHFKKLVLKPSGVISTDVYPTFSTGLYGFVNDKPKSVWSTRQRNRTVFVNFFSRNLSRF